MNTVDVRALNGVNRLSKRKACRYRQAIARRRLQELREEKLLRSWLTEVWDQSPALIEIDSRSNTNYRL